MAPTDLSFTRHHGDTQDHGYLTYGPRLWSWTCWDHRRDFRFNVVRDSSGKACRLCLCSCGMSSALMISCCLLSILSSSNFCPLFPDLSLLSVAPNPFSSVLAITSSHCPFSTAHAISQLPLLLSPPPALIFSPLLPTPLHVSCTSLIAASKLAPSIPTSLQLSNPPLPTQSSSLLTSYALQNQPSSFYYVCSSLYTTAYVTTHSLYPSASSRHSPFSSGNMPD